MDRREDWGWTGDRDRAVLVEAGRVEWMDGRSGRSGWVAGSGWLVESGWLVR